MRVEKRMSPIGGFFIVALIFGCVVDGLALEREFKQFMASPATLALDVYQRYISPAKGNSCPMDPSDSTYARQAVQRYGLFRGALMAADRLHRCGHDGDRYTLVRTSRGLKYSDPVDRDSQEPAH